MTVIERLTNYLKEQNKAILATKIVQIIISAILNIILFITPFVLFEKPTSFLEYTIIFPCHVLPIFSTLAFLVSIWSNVVSGILHLITTLLLFGHCVMLMTYLFLGNAWRLGVVIEFLLMILSCFTFIFNLVTECNTSKVSDDYAVQIDDATTGNQDSVYKL